ncbi:acyltransferase family protein [Streptomyces sodiiphilus]|uniref:Acyltransferase family protein n=1 Tax=Streptomyces sodiiphilus TaxID=226217 RepID=A0ABN2NRL7_9ACTN
MPRVPRGPLAALRRTAEQTPARRNRQIDMLRALALCAVVLGHWLVIVVVHDEGGLDGDNLLGILPWTHWGTWVFQVMPVFFVVGGYSNAASLVSHREHGGDATTWLLGRTDRLLRPTTALLITLGAGATVATLLGADTDTIGTGVWLASMPLWFLAAYLAMVLTTPAAHALHRRAGLAVPVLLLVLAAAADTARLGLDVPAVGQANYLLVWLAIHQLGFCWRDGLLPSTARGSALLAAAALAALVLLAALPFSPYPVSMVQVPGEQLQNTAPPTLALAALGLTQTGLALLLSGPTNRWLARTGPWTAVVAANSVVLTLFLWHMTAAMIGALALYPTGLMPQPAVDTPAWFLLRIPWLLALTVILAAIVALFGRIETRTGPSSSGTRATGPGLPPWGWTALTVTGLSAAVAGLLGIALAGDVYHRPGGLPTAVFLAYFAGAGLLRLARARAPRDPSA